MLSSDYCSWHPCHPADKPAQSEAVTAGTLAQSVLSTTKKQIKPDLHMTDMKGKEIKIQTA